MRTKLKRISCLLLVVLCMASFSVTAFAATTDEGVTEPTTETTESTEPATSEEVSYSYTVDENGNITISVDSEAKEETVTVGTVVTNGGRLNLRTGAGMSYEIIDQLRPGEEVTVIGTEGDWYEVIVPEKRGYVHSDYLELMEKAKENSEIDASLINLILKMMLENMSTTTPDADTDIDADSTNNGAFTPDGNLSLIDDYWQLIAEATEDTPKQEKQFITVQTKAGNYFYIVIDRNGDEENVYFLNLVDEDDLFALMEDENGEANTPVCTCTDKCAVGAINTNCEICRSNMSECMGKEPLIEPEPTTEPVEEPDKGGSASFLPILILLIAGGAGGALYWFKFKKNKPKTKGDSDLDDYDFGEDEEDYDEETEADDAEESEDEN